MESLAGAISTIYFMFIQNLFSHKVRDTDNHSCIFYYESRSAFSSRFNQLLSHLLYIFLRECSRHLTDQPASYPWQVEFTFHKWSTTTRVEKLSGSALASVNVVYSMENIVQFAKRKDWLSCILCICVESCCRIVCRKQSDVHMIINCFSKMIYCVSEQL